jgi:nucleoside 2-deoxyribosyltransferase
MLEIYAAGFEVGIRRAGYESVRVDRVEHVGKIDDEIIAQIRRSRFVVADFTGHRAGVYFEAGFAMGLNLPVIWSCRRDHIDELHFDIRQFNCIDWTDPDELADRLQKRIEAVIGAGPREPLS